MTEHYEAYFILPEAENGDTWECLHIGSPAIVGTVMFSAQQVVDMKADRDRLAADRDRLAAQAGALERRVQELEAALASIAAQVDDAFDTWPDCQAALRSIDESAEAALGGQAAAESEEER